MIIDFDVHHGNGTQDIFYDSGDVLFCSLHQSPLYPGTGAANEIGAGPGEWKTLNIPLPPRTGDDGYRLACQELVMPAANRYRPDCIFVSAGYDGHWKDPLADTHLTVEGYADMIYYIMEAADAVCDNRVIATLEGGYNTDVLPYCVQGTIERLQSPTTHASDPFGPPEDESADAEDVVENIQVLHGL